MWNLPHVPTSQGVVRVDNATDSEVWNLAGKSSSHNKWSIYSEYFYTNILYLGIQQCIIGKMNIWIQFTSWLCSFLMLKILLYFFSYFLYFFYRRRNCLITKGPMQEGSGSSVLFTFRIISYECTKIFLYAKSIVDIL